MNFVQIRTGQWHHYQNLHGEKVVVPTTQEAADAPEAPFPGGSVQFGTGVRVVDDNDNVVEDWAVLRTTERAFELVSTLLERYQDR